MKKLKGISKKLGLIAFILCISFWVSFAQQSIKGKVVDSSGEILPGVTVIIKGTTSGTITDFDGNFTINAKEGATLVFSFVGMVAQEVVYNGQPQINITMQADAIGIEEVVAVGYGTMKKSDLTGATASINTETLTEIPMASTDQALQGKLSGVEITNTSGAPGAESKIRIRGANSINGDNSPLVVIDGFMGGKLNDINPSEIKSIEILKDASATAIYGSRGANGVILVTTKTGTDGLKVNLDAFYSFQSAQNTFDLLNPYDFSQIANAHTMAFSGKEMFSQDEINGFKQGGGTDWQDEIFRTAHLQNYSVTLNGGNEKTKYLVAANFVDNDGIIKNSNMKKYSFRVNLDSKLTDYASFGFRSYFYTKETSQFKGALGDNGFAVSDALSMPPTADVYDESGNYSDSGYSNVNNPIADTETTLGPVKDYNALLNSFVEFDIAQSLKLKIMGGLEYNSNKNQYFLTPDNYIGSRSNGVLNLYNSDKLRLQNTNILTYNKEIAEGHKINATFVNEYSKETLEWSQMEASDFPIDALSYNNIGMGQKVAKPSSGVIENSILSFLGRVNYNFTDRYYITVSLRADGASKFAKGNKWGYFPSASFAWRLSNESFLQDVSYISNLKYRLSYGVTGSQATDPYQSLGAFSSGADYAFNGTDLNTGLQLSRKENPNLKWEKTYQLNTGFDIGFWDEKVALIVDLYKKNTKDLLLDLPLPSQTGYLTQLVNIGEVENKGIDINVVLRPVEKTLKWTSNFTFSLNRNEVVDLGGEERTFPGGDTNFILQPGKPMGQFFGYVYDGVWRSSEADEAAKYGKKPGDAKIRDLDGDFKYTADDRTVIGEANPDFTLGWNNSLTYKNWDFNMFVFAKVGGDVINATSAKSLGLTNNIPTNVKVKDYWTQDNDDASFYAFSTRNSNTILRSSSLLLEDGSFVRLQSLSLGYSFKGELLSRAGIEKLRCYVNGQNLLVITDYSGYDPETSNSKSDTTPGLDRLPYPSPKSITFGVNLTF